MNKQNTQKKRRVNIFLYLYLLLILLLLLTVASYTWFSLTKTPRVSDLSLHVATTSGMELALTPDAEEWKLQLDFLDMVDQTAPLRPVTWSEQSQQFFAATYGVDGRLTDVWEPLTDSRNANKDNADGYYICGTFYARTGTNVSVSLSPAVEVDEGLQGSGTYLIGTPVWNTATLTHDNGGQGAENAIRVGIRITYVNQDGSDAEGAEPVFYIYEPNADLHLDGTTGYVNTPSIDGTETLIPAERMILQTASTWTEADPVQRSVVIRDLGEFTTETRLFDLTAGQMVRIDIYIWLEGQDADCTNQINQAQILANIQLDSNAGGTSGLVPIE